MQWKNKKKYNYANVLFLLLTTTFFVKKTNTEPQHNNLSNRIEMIQQIDTMLHNKSNSSIEQRQPLHTKPPIHHELHFKTTTTKNPTPLEFQTDDFTTPSYTFIKEIPQQPHTKKTHSPHIEIIHLHNLSNQPSIQKPSPTPYPMLTKTYTTQPTSSSKASHHSKKQQNTMYYLKSKTQQNKKTTTQEDNPCYIPIDFQEKKQQITKKQHQNTKENQTQTKTKTKTKKSTKTPLKIRFNKNKKTKQKTKKEKQEKQKTQTPLQQAKQQLLLKQKKEKQQQKLKAKQQKMFEKQKKKQQKQQLIEQLLKAKQQQKQNKPFFQKNTKTTQPTQHQTTPSHNQQTPSDDDLIQVLLLTDELLGKLPEEVINEFVQSDDFKLYEKVLSKYKTM